MADLCEMDVRPRPITAPRVNRVVRRLPGQSESMHPALLAYAATALQELPASVRTGDDLGPARGIAVALLLTLFFWCAIAFIVLW